MRASALALLIIAAWSACDADAASQEDAPPTLALTGNSEFEGRTIESLVFVPAQQPLENKVLTSLVPFRKGVIFHTADARNTIQKLYATGRYEDISIEAVAESGGGAEKAAHR